MADGFLLGPCQALRPLAFSAPLPVVGLGPASVLPGGGVGGLSGACDDDSIRDSSE